MVAMPEVPQVRHRRLAVNGTALHVAEAGPEHAPVVVLLHGFPQHWYTWRALITALDPPGPRDRPARVRLERRPPARLLDGRSGAGRPRRPRRAGDPPSRPRRARLGRLGRVPAGARAPRPRPPSRRRLRAPPLAATEVPRAQGVALVGDGPLRAPARRGVHDIPRLVLGRDRRRRFDVPTLLVGGDHDALLPAAVLRVPRNRAGTIAVRVVTGGHFVVDENPDAITAAVLGHLGDSAEPDARPAASPPPVGQDWRCSRNQSRAGTIEASKPVT